MFGGEIVENELDGLDHAILGEVVNNARVSMAQLATKVKSRPERVAERLKRMEKEGVIIQYRIGVDLDKLGLEHYKAILHIDKYSKEDEKKLLGYISGLSGSQYLIRNI